MDQLIKSVSEKVGISEDKARAAVEHVVAFMKDKLPAGLGEKLEGMMNNQGGDAGQGGSADMLGDITGKLGGMFGGGK